MTARPGLDALRHFAVALTISLLANPGAVGVVARGGMHDPDSYMRLVRIRDGLRHGVFGTVVQADAGGLGTDTSWSHLLDGVILALHAPLRAVLGSEAALRWAGAAIGPLSVGLLGAAAAWAVAPLCDRRWRWTAAVAVPLSPVTAAYGAFGCAHHHVALAASVVMLAGWTGRAVGRSWHAHSNAGIWAGCWAGLGIWLSPEVTPFALLAFGALGLGWLLGRPAATALAASRAFLAVILLGWLADPPLGGHGVAEIDRLSLVYLALGCLVAAAALWLGLVERMRLAPAARGAAGLLGAACAGAVWAAMYPQLLHGATGMLPRATARAFFGIIAEMRPARSMADATAACLAATVAALVAATLTIRPRSPLWAYATGCVACMVVLGLMHWRFAIYGQVAGAMALPVALTWISASGPMLPPASRPWARIATLAVVLLLPQWVLRAAQAEATPRVQAGSRRCAVRDMLPVLARYPDAVILDEIGDTPELLYRTSLRTMGSFYHHGIDAFMAARAAWRSPPSAAVPQAVRSTGATLILLCRNAAAGRDVLVADTPGSTLSDQLRSGQVPPWLEQIGAATSGGYQLFRVAGEAGSRSAAAQRPAR